MACYRPFSGFRTSGGDVVFVDNLRRNDVVCTLDLPCGRCIGCFSRRSQDWGMRGMHEAKMHKVNCAPTVTYDDAHVPYRGMINYPDMQKALKLLRYYTKQSPRYMIGNEYGEVNGRPHAHWALFGWQPDDLKYWRKSESGAKLYRSQWFEEKIWPWGHVEIGEVTQETVQYIAKYCIKRVYGDAAEAHYRRQDPVTGEFYQLPPESMHVSTKPAIGRTWYEKFGAGDVAPWDYVVADGKEFKPPRYYDKLLRRSDPDRYEEMQWERVVDARTRVADSTPERLATRELCALANATRFKRTL